MTEKFQMYQFSINSNMHVNPFVPNAPFLYPLKTSENLTVLCFQGVEEGYLGNEWVKLVKN